MKIHIALIASSMPPSYRMLESNSKQTLFAKMVKNTQLFVSFYRLEDDFFRVTCGITRDIKVKSIKDMTYFPYQRAFLSSPAFNDVAESIKTLDFIIEFQY